MEEAKRRCAACGAEHGKKAAFCTRCGRRVQETCTRCGEVLQGEWCPCCGLRNTPHHAAAIVGPLCVAGAFLIGIIPVIVACIAKAKLGLGGWVVKSSIGAFLTGTLFNMIVPFRSAIIGMIAG